MTAHANAVIHLRDHKAPHADARCDNCETHRPSAATLTLVIDPDGPHLQFWLCEVCRERVFEQAGKQARRALARGPAPAGRGG